MWAADVGGTGRLTGMVATPMAAPAVPGSRRRAAVPRPTPPASSAPVLRLPGWARWLAAPAVGVALGLAWQPTNLWPLAFVAPALFTLLVVGVRRRAAFGLGYLFALGMLVPAIGWIRVLGTGVAAGLIVFMALFYALLAVALSRMNRLRGWPVWAAAGWVGCEFVFSHVPFGGFGWTRLAYAVVDSPLAGWYPLVGMAGVTFAVALISHLLLWLAAGLVRHRTELGSWVRQRGTVVVAALLVAIAVTGVVGQRVDPVIGASEQGSVTVGVVQGNVPGRGIEAMGRMRSVTNNHLAETVNLITRARLGLAATPDLVLWPESSTDIDPTEDPLTAATIEAAARTAGVPILVGAVTRPGPGERQTTALWWVPGQGPVASYHKQDLVPFGEWIPFRDVLLPLVPMLELVGDQGVPGTRPGAIPVQLSDGRQIVLGDVICFELAYDDTVHAMVSNGAQVVVVQSNNATYGGTGQIEQQFAITRARAMELRREIAVATTNSVSGSIDRYGTVLERTDEFTAASLTADLPVRNGLTPAVLVGPWLDSGLAALAALVLLYGVVVGLRRRIVPASPVSPVDRSAKGVDADRRRADRAGQAATSQTANADEESSGRAGAAPPGDRGSDPPADGRSP